jgi:hypothetical protein
MLLWPLRFPVLLFQAVLNALRFARAARLNNALRYREALEVLSRFRSHPDHMARKTLFEAHILHRKGDIPAAIERYETFLREGLQNIEPSGDKDYLELHCWHWWSVASRKAGHKTAFEVSQDDLNEAARQASQLAIAEFPP